LAKPVEPELDTMFYFIPEGERGFRVWNGDTPKESVVVEAASDIQAVGIRQWLAKLCEAMPSAFTLLERIGQTEEKVS
jgi:hypothetical protein